MRDVLLPGSLSTLFSTQITTTSPQASLTWCVR